MVKHKEICRLLDLLTIACFSLGEGLLGPSGRADHSAYARCELKNGYYSSTLVTKVRSGNPVPAGVLLFTIQFLIPKSIPSLAFWAMRICILVTGECWWSKQMLRGEKAEKGQSLNLMAPIWTAVTLLWKLPKSYRPLWK